MSENIMKVKETLDISTHDLDNYLKFCEENISNKIKDFCNINDIPERLNSVIQEFLIEQYNLNKDGIGKGVQIVSSASDNGQTVNFKTEGGVIAMSKNAEEFIQKNAPVLVKYRKLRW